MSGLPLTKTLRREYEALFATCVVNPDSVSEVERIARGVMADRERYTRVAEPLGIPWSVVAVLHVLEASRSFGTHLHNGDPLSARTVRVPAGRPTGAPPFAWEDSAADALRLMNFQRASD